MTTLPKGRDTAISSLRTDLNEIPRIQIHSARDPYRSVLISSVRGAGGPGRLTLVRWKDRTYSESTGSNRARPDVAHSPSGHRDVGIAIPPHYHRPPFL